MRLLKILLLTLATTSFSQGDEVLSGELFYDPPAFLGGTRPAKSYQSGRIEYLGQDSSYDRHRQLNIDRMEIGVTLAAGGRPVYEKLDDAALKAKMKIAFQGPRLRNQSEISEVTIGGRKALKVSYEITMDNHPKKAVFTFEVYWIRAGENRVLQLSLSANPAEQLADIRESLNTIVLKDPPKADSNAPLPTTKDSISLGDIRSDVSKKCGNSLSAGPYYDVYFMDPYVAFVTYQMPNVESIRYSRPTDAKKLVESYKNFEKNGVALTTLLEAAEVQTILERHASDTNLWKAEGNNRWIRSDGAVAFLWKKQNTLLLTTKEGWTRIEASVSENQ